MLGDGDGAGQGNSNQALPAILGEESNQSLRESTDVEEEIEGGGLNENGSFDDQEDDEVLEFDVQRKSLPNFMGESIANPYSLLINQTLGRLTIVKKAKWNRRYDVKLIEKVELACENARLLHIEWKKDLVAQDLSPQSRVPIHKRHSYIFASAHERQQFYEATLHAMFKRGSLSVPPLDITEDKTLYHEKVSIFIGTWNMGLAPPPASLDAWVPKDKYDIYFIGFQESGWTSGAKIPQTQILSYMWDTQEQEVLFGGLQKLLGPGYVRYAQRSLWQMRYVLFVRAEHVSSISNLQGNMFTTGVGGIVGDKGALGISLQFNHTSICFLTCHLAPHEGGWLTRNAHVQAIAHGLQLGTQEIPCDLTNRFDYMFWSGDLNYRISLPRDKVLELIEKEDWEALKKHDQLLNEKVKGNCFVGFHEGDLNFRPTYRYNRGDRTYSTQKMRTPSWTDRVLWKSLPGLKAKLTAYGCSDEITTSDHSPVYAAFEVDTLRLIPTQPIPREIPLKYTIVITDLWAKGLIHKFEVKKIEDDMKRREEERKKRLHKMAEQAKQPASAAEGGMLGQVGNWWSSWWGAKPGAASTQPAQRPPEGNPPPPAGESGDGAQVEVPADPESESRNGPGGDPIPDSNDTRGEGTESEASKPVVEEKEANGEEAPESSDPSTADGQHTETKEAEPCRREEEKEEEEKEDRESEEQTAEYEGNGKETASADAEEAEEGLVSRDVFLGPAVYMREEEVPIAPYICFAGASLDGLKRTPAVGYTRNPVWRDGEVPRLRPFVNSKEWLSLQYITLVVRDESFWSGSYDDMGQAVIPLREACGERPVPFSMPLLYEGKPQGVVSGKIHVVIDGMQVSSAQISPRYLSAASPTNGNSPLSGGASPPGTVSSRTLPFTSSVPFASSSPSSPSSSLMIQRAHTVTPNTSSASIPISMSVPVGGGAASAAGSISPSFLPFPSPPSTSSSPADLPSHLPMARKRSSSNPLSVARAKSTFHITDLVGSPATTKEPSE